jgi:O-antigen ligase
VQSAEFSMCAAVLLYIALGKAHEGRRGEAVALVVLALAFLANVFFVVTSRTTLVIIPALVVLYGLWRFGWKGAIGAALAGLVMAGALWAASPYMRGRVTAIFTEAHVYETRNIPTSTGERIVFWTKSLRFIAEAPLFGHGTGSIKEMFQKSAVGQTGVRAEISTNPHNQTFAVAIQLGLVGIAVLWAMWIAHLLLFRGSALLDWIGLVLVAQNVVGSLFNSFLFDFTEGWIYFVGIGVAAGMVRRRWQHKGDDTVSA